MQNQNIGILAGAGKIVLDAIQKASKLYKKIVIISFDFKKNEIKNFPNIKVYQSHPGLLKKNLKILKNEKIDKILFIGKLNKAKILKEKKFDLIALKLFLSLKERSDASILQALVNFFESNNISVISQKEFFNDMVMPYGLITKSKFSKSEISDAKWGFNIAKKIAQLGIGQSIVIDNRIVLAVEGIEGTDKMIKRVKNFTTENSIFIKVIKPKQNPKFDLPAFGINTLKLLFNCKIKKIVLEAGWVVLIEKEKIIEFANKHKMKIMGI